LRGFLEAWLLVFGGGVACVCLLTLLPIPTLPYDLGGLPLQTALALMAMAALAMALKHRIPAVGLFLIALLQVLRCLLPQPVVHTPYWSDLSGQPPAVRVLLANVHSQNDEYGALLDLVDREDPDIIGLLEVNSDWERAVRSLSERYPYQTVHSRQDNFGIAIFSRLELMNPSFLYLGAADVPTATSQVVVEDHEVTLVLTHPVPPTSFQYASYRDSQLSELANLVPSLGARVVVMGDLNATPQSNVFRTLLSMGKLSDTQRGVGLHGTWPAQAPAPLRIRLDHVLLGGNVDVAARHHGPSIGSDHLPVIVDLVLLQ
jgi:endonuclease/exonuclease/phosphatase (EEP) superfamily protein YafD